MPGAGASGCRLGAGVPGGTASDSVMSASPSSPQSRGRTVGRPEGPTCGRSFRDTTQGLAASRRVRQDAPTRPVGRSLAPTCDGPFSSQKCFHRRWATRTAFRPTSESVARHDTVTALQHPTLKAPDRLPSLRSSAAPPARERPSASRPKYPHARHPACHRPHPDRSSSTVSHPCTTRLVVGLGRSPGRAGPV